jgi:hypothetical protein
VPTWTVPHYKNILALLGSGFWQDMQYHWQTLMIKEI